MLNAQGDVIALLNSAGALVASYNYGAWGNYSVHDKDGKKTTDANRTTSQTWQFGTGLYHQQYTYTGQHGHGDEGR